MDHRAARHPSHNARGVWGSSGYAVESFTFLIRMARVRRLRLERGWTQDVLSVRSGLHRAHIGEIERGETNVTLQTLKTLADTLAVRITDLVKGF
jgi:DNA-binding XRE family transcriptional regulator